MARIVEAYQEVDPNFLSIRIKEPEICGIEVGNQENEVLTDAIALAVALNSLAAKTAESRDYTFYNKYFDGVPDLLDVQRSLLTTLEQDPNPGAFTLVVPKKLRATDTLAKLKKAVRLTNGDTMEEIEADDKMFPFRSLPALRPTDKPGIGSDYIDVSRKSLSEESDFNNLLHNDLLKYNRNKEPFSELIDPKPTKPLINKKWL